MPALTREERLAKKRATQKLYYEANKEAILKQQQEYRLAHREEQQAYHKAYHQKHHAAIIEKKQKYLEANRENINAAATKRRPARKTKMRAWRTEKKEHLAAYQKRYHITNEQSLRQKRRDYKVANKEKHSAYMKDYRETHKEPLQVQLREYRNTHKDRLKGQHQIWVAANREKVSGYSRTRRARKNNAPINDLTTEQWEEIKTVYNYRCVYCPADCKPCKRKTHRLTQEHLTPLSKNGPNTASNVVPACRSCNSKKGPRKVLCPVQPLLLTVATSL